MNIIINSQSKYFPIIDVVKGLAIISVILLHTIPVYIDVYTLYLFHIYQAVPMFMFITGITVMITFSKTSAYTTIKDFYNKKYFGKKVTRIVYPFLMIFLASLIYGLWNHDYYLGLLSLIGYLPVTGPGNYYITILLEFVIIAPLLAYFYKKYPKLLLICMVLLDFGFQLIAPYIGLLNGYSYLYSACILRYFSVIALGMFVTDEFLTNGYVNLKNKKYRLIMLALPISVLYIITGLFVKQPIPLFKPEWGTQNIISYAYTFIITVLLLNLDITRFTDNIIYRFITLIGKASYHIFLVQILFFGSNLTFVNFVTKNNELLMGGPAILLNLITTITLGILFYRLEPSISTSIDNNIKSIINTLIRHDNITR